MAKKAEILFQFENAENKVTNYKPINYSDHYSDKYFNISMIQEIIDSVITNEVKTTYHLRNTSIESTEFIWQKDISNSYNVYKHLKIYGDNSNFKIKYSSDDTNSIELPISNNKEFYMYLSDDLTTLNVKCQDLWYEITVTDQNTLTYTTSESSDFNLLPSPEKNNIVYKDDLDRYTYSKIKVGDNLKGKKLRLRNDEKAVNKFLYNIAKDNYMHSIIRGKDGSDIAYTNKTEDSYMGFYIKYANTSTYNSTNTVSFIGSGYRPSRQTIITCTEDFIVTSISAGWDDILMIIDEVPLLSTKEDLSNKVSIIDTNNTYTHYDYPNVNSVIEYVQSSINSIQETINIQKDSSITDEGIGKLDIASANIFTTTTEPHFYKVGVADTTLYNGILYNGTVPFKNVTDDSLVRIQKDAVIYYAGGVAYCFTGEGIYSLLWDDTEKKGWVTKVKMDNESYYIYEKQDSLPNVTVTAGDFTWDATERTLTATGAASTTKTATIKFNEAVDGVYFSLSNNSGTGRMGILSAKVNNEDYYIGLLQGLGTEYTQWYMQKDDVLTITYQGDSTSTADETFVFKIEHWQKPAQTTSVASYTNYAIGNSELNEQMTTARISQEVANLRYDLNNLSTGNSSNILTIADATGTRGITVTNSGEEWRLLGDDGIDGLIYTLPTSMPEEFTSHVTFKAAYGCTVTVENWTPHYSGDDVANGIFTPVEGTVYDLAFYWNGFYVVCIIKGTN